ncbi:MAG: CDP-alcohol phosphatidyltransferase family protein [Candidatus Nanopelagicaceae bacterium]|nr:CDP-alcohol phosphatidyltransferase family protein [Candidatus Nanopelagicaceae bacterium]
MKREKYFSEWSNLHGDAKVKGIVKGWLSISYSICSFIAKLRITPNGLSYLSLLLAAGFVFFIDSNWAIAFLVLSLTADGLDGTLAIITGRVSKWGAALDALADRIVEALWAYGLFLLGAPLEMVVLAWLAAFVQEYMRARAGGLGFHNIGVVTFAERPIRASMVFIVLVARAVELDFTFGISIIWAVLQSISAITVFFTLRQLLQQSQR